MTASPQDIERLLARCADLRADMTAMPWAEPPEQPTPFDRRDIEEADEFAVLMAARNRGAV